MKVTLFLYLYSISYVLISQNLIYNGDFEMVIDCPDDPANAIGKAKGWSTTSSFSSPDLFHSCQRGIFGSPDYNFSGKKKSSDGMSFVGFVAISDFNKKEKDYREYIQGSFIEPLKVDVVYLVSFDISWSSRSTIFCDRLGYLFSGEKISIHAKDEEGSNLRYSTGHVNLLFEEFKDRSFDKWINISFNYKANGGEQFLILGVFKDQLSKKEVIAHSKSKYEPFYNSDFDVSGFPYAYYYIDNVSVVPLSIKIQDFTHH